MRTLTSEEVQIALGKLKNGLGRYVWLQDHIGLCDVSTNEHFQRRFNGFYRVRRGLLWRTAYYGLMESAKATGIDFPDALKEIYRRTGRIEASFSSKLVATVDQSKPVIDRFVLANFELRLPRWGLLERESETIDVYRKLCAAYGDFIEGPIGTMMRQRFEREYPNSGISELKKIDLVLWQIRS